MYVRLHALVAFPFLVRASYWEPLSKEKLSKAMKLSSMIQAPFPRDNERQCLAGFSSILDLTDQSFGFYSRRTGLYQCTC